MNIVVLDGFTLNPGDLRWDALTALGECTIHDRTPDPEIISRARSAEIVLTNKTPLTRETITQLPRSGTSGSSQQDTISWTRQPQRNAESRSPTSRATERCPWFRSSSPTS